MTVAEGIASLLLWSINIGLACVLIFWCRHKYRVDALRYRLLVCRDELFDLALAGTLGFGDQASEFGTSGGVTWACSRRNRPANQGLGIFPLTVAHLI